MARHYFSFKWPLVYGYLVAVFALDPKFPKMISWASSKWTYQSVADFVLLVEVAIAVLVVSWGAVVFSLNRRRFVCFMLIIGGGITVSFLFYRFYIPNPYELTHLPEYAVLGALVLLAMRNHEETSGGADPTSDPPGGLLHNRCCQSLAFAMVISVIDELYHGILPTRYFTYYDLFLNGLGAVMGVTLVWALGSRKAATD